MQIANAANLSLCTRIKLTEPAADWTCGEMSVYIGHNIKFEWLKWSELNWTWQTWLAFIVTCIISFLVFFINFLFYISAYIQRHRDRYTSTVLCSGWPQHGPSGALSYDRSQQQSLTISGKVAVGIARDSRNFSGRPYIGRIVRSSLR